MRKRHILPRGSIPHPLIAHCSLLIAELKGPALGRATNPGRKEEGEECRGFVGLRPGQPKPEA